MCVCVSLSLSVSLCVSLSHSLSLSNFVVPAFPSIAPFTVHAQEDYMQPLRLRCDFYDARLAARAQDAARGEKWEATFDRFDWRRTLGDCCGFSPLLPLVDLRSCCNCSPCNVQSSRWSNQLLIESCSGVRRASCALHASVQRGRLKCRLRNVLGASVIAGKSEIHRFDQRNDFSFVSKCA